MVNITHKSNTLRQAVATAVVVVSKYETIDAIKNRKVPKGDVFEFARAAGLLAIKKTSDLIPDCHPLPVEYTAITYAIDGLSIHISVEVHTIYKTGVEVETMHGASIVALVMYDMLKPIDQGIEISSIRLQKKKGGKADLKNDRDLELKCAVVVCSDSISEGRADDATGKAIIDKLGQYSLAVSAYVIIPDEIDDVQATARQLCREGYQLVLFTGGTGLSQRDITPEAISPLLNREIPGIMEVARNYGQQRTPFAMLSRGVAGFIGDTLVITLPGSISGATETVDALFPYVLHVFKVVNGARHE